MKKFFFLVAMLMSVASGVLFADDYWDNKLIEACQKNNFADVKTAINRGAIPNFEKAIGNYIYTPLVYACQKNNIQLARYLVDNGA